MKIYEECAGQVEVMQSKDFFREFSCENWIEYYKMLRQGSLDEIDFAYGDIDRDIFGVLDGGEMIRLKTGEYYIICWRGDVCRVWLEEDAEIIQYYNALLGIG